MEDVNVLIGLLTLNLLVASVYFSFLSLFYLCFINIDFFFVWWFCFDICIQGNCELGNGSTVYGFAFVDSAALKFWVGSISDDASCATLGALLMQVCFVLLNVLNDLCTCNLRKWALYYYLVICFDNRFRLRKLYMKFEVTYLLEFQIMDSDIDPELFSRLLFLKYVPGMSKEAQKALKKYTSTGEWKITVKTFS